MSARYSKEHWIDGIKEKIAENGTLSIDADVDILHSMTRRQLFLVEHIVAMIRNDSCCVGCGECEWCNEQNKMAANRAATGRIKR